MPKDATERREKKEKKEKKKREIVEEAPAEPSTTDVPEDAEMDGHQQTVENLLSLTALVIESLPRQGFITGYNPLSIA